MVRRTQQALDGGSGTREIARHSTGISGPTEPMVQRSSASTAPIATDLLASVVLDVEVVRIRHTLFESSFVDTRRSSPRSL